MSGLSLSHDGAPMPDERVHDLLGCLLSSDRVEPFCSELAIGINAALGFPGAVVLLESGTAWIQLGATHSGVGSQKARQLTRVTVRRPLGWAGWLRRRTPEELLLREYARFAPLDLNFNGERIQPTFGRKARLGQWAIPWPGKYLGVMVTDSGQEGLLDRRALAWETRVSDCPGGGHFQLGPPLSGRQAGSSPRECRAVVALYVDPTLPSLLRWLRHGVVIQTEQDWPLDSSCEVMLAAEDLPTDLSGLSFQEGKALEKRRQWLERLIMNAQSRFRRESTSERLEDALVQAALCNGLAQRL